MNVEIGNEAARSFISRNICFEFSVQCTSPIALLLRKEKKYLHTLEMWVSVFSSWVIKNFPQMSWMSKGYNI